MVSSWESKLIIDCSSLIFIREWNIKGRSSPSAQITVSDRLLDEEDAFWRGLLNEGSRNDEWRNVRSDNFSRNCSIRLRIFFEGCLAERWTTNSSRIGIEGKAVVFSFKPLFWPRVSCLYKLSSFSSKTSWRCSISFNTD